MTKWMVAVDGSEPANNALEWTISRVKEGDEVFLITVFESRTYIDDIPLQTLSFSMQRMDPDTERDFPEERRARGILRDAVKRCEEANVKCSPLLWNGNPREVITDEVERKNIDNLVMGQRGLGTVKRVILGSVSDYCVHHANCSVTIVKQHKH